jgi:hypothetical protein
MIGRKWEEKGNKIKESVINVHDNLQGEPERNALIT